MSGSSIAADNGSLITLVEAALEVSRWESALLRRIRAALEGGDDDLALRLTKHLVGLDDETGDRTDSRLN